jgi:hypothetical protein
MKSSINIESCAWGSGIMDSRKTAFPMDQSTSLCWGNGVWGKSWGGDYIRSYL